ncbi:alcohol dehydrogenase family protein [Gaiella sp.]|uniref:alcohol dehydrogenase family protein n=1 Tax=Gaiella sp. TaxID=2663207 RepID=UPI003983AB05
MVTTSLSRLPEVMRGVVLTGHGGTDRLVYREDLALPLVNDDEVLIEVAAAGVNNTDINTRVGWYSKETATGTDAANVSAEGDSVPPDGAWSGAPLAFPLIQGADCCGRIVRVGASVAATRIGQRVLVRPMMRPPASSPLPYWTLGSECDGAFAEYVAVPSREAYRVESAWSDVELASLPCAYSTAENLLHRAAVVAGERVLVTGASGGVGSAAVQLAKRRGAEVVGVASPEKAGAVRALGAEAVIPRGDEPAVVLGPASIDVVIDVVGGPGWPPLLAVLRNGGRLATSGAIAGPVVALDLRTLYLKDLTLLGCTVQEPIVFENLIRYVERGEIEPVVSRTYPLREIVRAQEEFITKSFTGKLVLVVAPSV